MATHKEYKIMVKSKRDGGWYRVTHGVKNVYKDKGEALKAAERYMKNDREREWSNWTECKLLERTVTEWEDAK